MTALPLFGGDAIEKVLLTLINLARHDIFMIYG
jgi:hypothetical protein